ncbi:hypothetical protein Agub_g2451, partial [Astrephomene gubernaculifera]
MALHSLCQFKGAGRVARCGLVEARPAVAFHAHVLRPRDRARPFKPHISEACTCRSYAGSGASSSTSGSPRREAQLESLRGELRALEEERDTAVRTAESCARTCVRLADMTQLLEDLALEKVKAGDEAGAKLVLQEKAALREIIEGSNSKAQTNFALAGKLAALIGSKHSQLLELMAVGGQTPGAGAGAGAGTATSSSSSSSSSSWAAGPSYPTNGAGGAGGGGSSWPQPPTTSTSTSTTFSSPGQQQLPWERSLRDAQERVRQAESEAAQLGRLAALSAEDGIAAARERLRQR